MKELKEGLKVDFQADDLKQLENAVSLLDEKIKSEKYLITLSELGVYIKNSDKSHHIAAHLREISDVSGAGDTVISTAALCLALNLPLRFIAELANLSGGLVCEHVGVVPINKHDLFEEGKNIALEYNE